MYLRKVFCCRAQHCHAVQDRCVHQDTCNTDNTVPVMLITPLNV